MLRARMVMAILVVAGPLNAIADRGALSLEAGGIVVGVRAEPAVGAGDAVTGTVGGVSVGTRYALSNHLELTGTLDWFTPAAFYNDNTVITTSNGTFAGQLQSRLGGYSASAGARYVTGLVWRLHAGAEVGWLHRSFTRIDLIDVSRPAYPTSFGLGLGTRKADNVMVSPMVGIEWLVSDRLSLAVIPRVQLMLGSPGAVWVTVPLTISYSWYGLFT